MPLALKEGLPLGQTMEILHRLSEGGVWGTDCGERMGEIPFPGKKFGLRYPQDTKLELRGHYLHE